MAPKKDEKQPAAKGGGGGAMGVTPAPPRYPEGEVCFLSTTYNFFMWKDLLISKICAIMSCCRNSRNYSSKQF